MGLILGEYDKFQIEDLYKKKKRKLDKLKYYLFDIEQHIYYLNIFFYVYL